jgi:hypothetical protein
MGDENRTLQFPTSFVNFQILWENNVSLVVLEYLKFDDLVREAQKYLDFCYEKLTFCFHFIF